MLTATQEPGVPGAVAQRLQPPSWRNGRVAFGLLLVVVATLAGALLLRQADHTIPVFAAARDLPSGVPLVAGDFEVVRARLGPGQLPAYVRPGKGWVGAELTQPLRTGMFVPSAFLQPPDAKASMALVEIPLDPSDAVVTALEPGDRVQVLATPTQGAAPHSSVLLPDAEVTAVVAGSGGLVSSDGGDGVMVEVEPSTLPAVAAAVANDKLTVAKLPPGSAQPAATGGG